MKLAQWGGVGVFTAFWMIGTRSSLFEYVLLRAKCVRSFVLGGIGSLSLSLVCFRSFSRVESLSFFLSLSLFKQHQVISRSRGRRVSWSNRLLPRSNKSSSRVISSFSTTPKTLPKLVYRILLLLTCDDTVYALGLQSFLYHIKCAFFCLCFSPLCSYIIFLFGSSSSFSFTRRQSSERRRFADDVDDSCVFERSRKDSRRLFLRESRCPWVLQFFWLLPLLRRLRMFLLLRLLLLIRLC